MTLMRLRHGTHSEHIPAIREQGLIPHKPTDDGNYASGWDSHLGDQPRGVYAFPIDGKAGCWGTWAVEFAWCGQILPDPILGSSVAVILEPVPLECIYSIDLAHTPSTPSSTFSL